MPQDISEPQVRCLIVGAGEAGRAIAAELNGVASVGVSALGFVDDDSKKKRVAGLPVLGTTSDLEEILSKWKPSLVVIAIPDLDTSIVRMIAATSASFGIGVRYLPSFLSLLTRGPELEDLRAMDLEALLGRDEARVVRATTRTNLKGKRVLITGAGGSIGSELCRQISGAGPSQMWLLDHDESNLHATKMRLEGEARLDSDDLIIADIRDRQRIEQLFAELKPEVVFHTAAHKHLPLLEQFPVEGVKTNVLGTRNLAESAVRHGVERFISISTDKAADPISILGVTKLLSERVLTQYIASDTMFSSVRFGNVLGSRGTFIAVMAEQLAAGEEVTVTHPDVTRFFMTIEEACGLVLEASALGGEAQTFVLDMGAPVRIVDMVYAYAQQLHMDEASVRIKFTGLRPGEKLHEALVAPWETALPTDNPRISAVMPPTADATLSSELSLLESSAQANNVDDVVSSLCRLVPTWKPEPIGEKALVTVNEQFYPDDF